MCTVTPTLWPDGHSRTPKHIPRVSSHTALHTPSGVVYTTFNFARIIHSPLRNVLHKHEV